MLTPNQIKQLCQYAEGCDLINDGDEMFPEYNLYYNGAYACVESPDLQASAVYDILLQRAIEGICLKHCYTFSQCNVSTSLTKPGYSHVHTYQHKPTTIGIRTAKEEVLKWYLNQTK